MNVKSRIFMIAIVSIAIVLTVFRWLVFNNSGAAIGIIGGSDGPTQIFVSSNIAKSYWIMGATSLGFAGLAFILVKWMCKTAYTQSK